VIVHAAGTDRPYLARFERIITYSTLALKFRGRDEPLNTVAPEHITEVRVAELRCADSLLLLFNSPPFIELLVFYSTLITCPVDVPEGE
jgi:hypothetical protein